MIESRPTIAQKRYNKDHQLPPRKTVNSFVFKMFYDIIAGITLKSRQRLESH